MNRTQVCTHCGCKDTEYRGMQKGIDPRNMRGYQYPIWQCNSEDCGTSFGGEKRYLDTQELVPPRELIVN